MVTYEELLQRQLIKKIEATEKDKYALFHEVNYKLEMLKQSADKRKRYTYYSANRSLLKVSEQTEEAKHFLENVVKPYIFIVEKLKC